MGCAPPAPSPLDPPLNSIQRRTIPERIYSPYQNISPAAPTETFQYTDWGRHFTSCHPPGVKNGLINGEASRFRRTNSSKTIFEEALSRFKTRPSWRARLPYASYIYRENTTSEINFSGRQSALKQKAKTSVPHSFKFLFIAWQRETDLVESSRAATFFSEKLVLNDSKPARHLRPKWRKMTHVNHGNVITCCILN